MSVKNALLEAANAQIEYMRESVCDSLHGDCSKLLVADTYTAESDLVLLRQFIVFRDNLIQNKIVNADVLYQLVDAALDNEPHNEG